jgi:hypothetical protein
MKRAVLCIAAALCAAGVIARGQAGLEGSWSGKTPGPDGRTGPPVTFTFHANASKSTGTVLANGQTFNLVDVKLDGNTLTFAVEGEEQNKYRGTIAGDELKMQVKYPSGENGVRTWAFVLKREASLPPAAAASRAAVDGDWQGEVPRGESRYIKARSVLHADGASLTGTVYALGDEFPIVDGTIKGQAIAFRVGTTTGEYSGTIGTDAIQMKVRYDGGESGRQTLPFVLTRTPE